MRRQHRLRSASNRFSAHIDPRLVGLGLVFAVGTGTYLAYASEVRRRRTHGLADDAPGRAARQSRFGRYAVTGRTVTIDRPRSQVYAFWRDFSNLPLFMENVERIEESGERTIWTIRGPADSSWRIVTTIVSDRPDKEIAWRSTEESDIETSGKVLFSDAPAGRGTELEAVIAYIPPAGRIGQVVAKLFQAEPSIQGRRELKRLKMLLETGEVATSSNRKSET